MFRSLFRRKSKTPQPTQDKDPKKAPSSDEPDAGDEAPEPDEADEADAEEDGPPDGAEDADADAPSGDVCGTDDDAAPDAAEDAGADAGDVDDGGDPPSEASESAEPGMDVATPDAAPEPAAAAVVEAPPPTPETEPAGELASAAVIAQEPVVEAPPVEPVAEVETAVDEEPPADEIVAEAEDSPADAEEPPKKRGFFRRLVDGLSKTRATLTRQVTSLLSFGRSIDEDLLEELEEVLIQADVGVPTTMRLVERLREEAAKQGLRDASELQPLLRAEIEAIFAGGDVAIDVDSAKPFVLLVIGVNGVGKTTTIGKLAARWTGEGKKVVVAAADTFRAAAIEQLEVWCDRAGADLIRQEQGSDAASVVYDAVHAANARDADVLIIDTAGRLHTKKNLMQELEKINRVTAREVEGAPHEVLLVLDATTGQNAVEQARQFSQITAVSGIALTKLDSSAKGGVVIAVCDELDIPVKLIGIGESIDDLRDFDGAAFVEALLSEDDA